METSNNNQTRVLKLKFKGIDDWNRPVFKDIEKKQYYGSTDILFSYNATEKEVMEEVNRKEQLTWFGSSFGCEPMGCRIKEEVKVEFVK